MTDYSEWNDILPSEECTRCKNPIRIYVENVLSKAKPNPHKSKITFTLGDPAVYPEFQVGQAVTQLISQDIEKSLALQSPEGPLASREYLAKVYSTDFWKLTSDDIFLTMGGSSGMWFLLNVLANPGDSILVPHPGFPLIFALAENRDINLITYELENGKDGHVDLADLEEKLKTHNPKLLLLNNPSNPLGTVWSEDHIKSILHLADVYKVPVVADEMYETLVFDPTKAQSIGKLSRGQPVFVFSGLSKLCFVPGWRCGWIACYGNQEIIGGVKEGLRRLCQMYQHPNAVSALKIPQVFEASKKFATEKMVLVEKKAQSIEQKLKGTKGISLYNTKGAFYLSIFIDFKMFKGIDNSQSFALKLLEEENVNVLPGSLFFKDDMIRLVILCSDDDIDEFSMRFKEFCARHMVEEKESDN